MVSVAPRDAHKPPLALVCTAGRPAMVVYADGHCYERGGQPAWGGHNHRTRAGPPGWRGVWY